jgi:hypothetical protein
VESQQTPSTQKPEPHWLLDEQVAPRIRGPHWPWGSPVLDVVQAEKFEQEESQQKPSIQNFDSHSVETLHVPPIFSKAKISVLDKINPLLLDPPAIMIRPSNSMLAV